MDTASYPRRLGAHAYAEFFTGEGRGRGADPDAIYNLCLIVKIVL
jgi:hypothetical protein